MKKINDWKGFWNIFSRKCDHQFGQRGLLSEWKIGIYIMSRDGKIDRLKEVTNERSFQSQDCCGMHIKPDDLIRFKLCIACINGKMKEGIKAVRLHDVKESCTIDFLKRNIIMTRRDNFVGQFYLIIELYKNCDSKVLRKKVK